MGDTTSVRTPIILAFAAALFAFVLAYIVFSFDVVGGGATTADEALKNAAERNGALVE